MRASVPMTESFMCHRNLALAVLMLFGLCCTVLGEPPAASDREVGEASPVCLVQLDMVVASISRTRLRQPTADLRAKWQELCPNASNGCYLAIVEDPKTILSLLDELRKNGSTKVIAVPGRHTQRIHTTAELEDGKTLLLGGLIQRTVTETERKTPLLSSIPWFGEFFTSKESTEEEQELVFLVTPHVVKPKGNSSSAP